MRSYKRLASVEKAFRALKGLDLLVRPIRHRVEPRVRAHLFLCALAYYVEWELRRAWAPLLFAEEELEEARRARDPVKPAQPSEEVKAKKKSKKTAEGLEVQSYRSLLAKIGEHDAEYVRGGGRRFGGELRAGERGDAVAGRSVPLAQFVARTRRWPFDTTPTKIMTYPRFLTPNSGLAAAGPKSRRFCVINPG